MTILFTILSISAISTVLSIFIVIAERFLNDYGECSIDINDGTRTIKVKGGDTLLSSLAANSIFIPSACGGKATCGLCKLVVTGGADELLPTEEPYLSDDERRSGIRLSCQIKVKRNISIVVPEEFFSIKEYKAKVERITDMTYDIKEFRFKLTDPREIDFKAGQYMQIKTKPYDKVQESVSRAYSISSVPSDKNAVELIVRRVPGGICTTYMHEYLKTGDEVILSGPYGEFYIRDDVSKYVFIAGGSGLAPIKSMIFDMIEKGMDKEMLFFFGAGSRKDLYYFDLFKDLEKKYDKFRYIPALSKPEPEDEWEGETGLITDVVSRYIEDEKNKHAYLCGSPGMLDACIRVLEDKGFTRQIVFFDKF